MFCINIDYMSILFSKALATPHRITSKITNFMFTQTKCCKHLRRNLVILINRNNQYSDNYLKSLSSFQMSFGH